MTFQAPYELGPKKLAKGIRVLVCTWMVLSSTLQQDTDSLGSTCCVLRLSLQAHK